MSAKKSKSKKEQSKPQTAKAEIDYDKLSYAIAHALIKADSIRDEKKEAERKDVQERLNRILGEKECPKNAGKIKCKLYAAYNEASSFWHFLWLKKENAKNIHAATAFAQMMLEFIFFCLEWLLYIATVVLIFSTFTVLDTFQIHFAGGYLPWALMSFFFARFFRLARFEIDYLNNKEYLIALLSGVASFLAMVFTLIGLFK